MRLWGSTRYRAKIDWLLPHVKGKQVLYIGTTDKDAENFRKHLALQRALRSDVESMVGVYQYSDQALTVREDGSDAVQANVEDLSLGNTFDVIVAADNLEHLSNCGLFISGMARHLTPQGSILISTPNPTSFVRILELLTYGTTKTNVAHSCWFTEQVLNQLANRYGLSISSPVFIDEMHVYHRIDNPARNLGLGKRIATRLVLILNKIICPLFPQLSETFGFVLTRAEDCPDG